MRKFLYRAAMAAFLFFWSIGLISCGTTTAVLGGCEIPTQYDVVKAEPNDVAANATVKEFTLAATKDHAQHKIDVDDFNGFHDYVKANCK
jgi:hypothetical protein